MVRLIDIIAASVITVTIVLMDNDPALSLCTKIPWNVTVQEQGCLATTIKACACLGQCQTSALTTASEPFYKEETQGCAPAQLNTTKVVYICVCVYINNVTVPYKLSDV
jgi:hypothetical protein